MIIPKGKTIATIDGKVPQSRMQDGDIGYIDGYIRGGDGKPYAVFVRTEDGEVGMVSLYLLKSNDIY